MFSRTTGSVFYMHVHVLLTRLSVSRRGIFESSRTTIKRVCERENMIDIEITSPKQEPTRVFGRRGNNWEIYRTQ